MYNESEQYKRFNAVSRADLNSFIQVDEGFSNRIKFIVEEYIGDNIPKEYEYNNIKDMLLKAYILKLDNKLHCITIKHNKLCMSTDILNLYDDINHIEVIKENYELKEQFQENEEILKAFLEKYHAKEGYKLFKEEYKRKEK